MALVVILQPLWLYYIAPAVYYTAHVVILYGPCGHIAAPVVKLYGPCADITAPVVVS